VSIEQHKAAVREFFATIDRDQNMAAAVDRLAAPNYIAHFLARRR
jgi:hypothetical protein